jgi:hypothetical protein
MALGRKNGWIEQALPVVVISLDRRWLVTAIKLSKGSESGSNKEGANVKKQSKADVILRK